MKKNRFWHLAALTVMFGMLFPACSDEPLSDPDEPEYETPEEADPLANDCNVPNNTIVLGGLSDQYEAAMALRFPNKVSEADYAQIALVDGSQVGSFSAELLKVYMNGGLIIVCQPKEETLQKWMREVNLPNRVALNGDQKLLYAFTRSHSYLMDEPWEGTEINDNLNYFIDWVNRTMRANESGGNLKVDGQSKVQDLINCQQFHYEVKYSLKVQEAHENGAAPDSITGVGSVVLAYNVYPIYVFNTEEGSNDEYYLVEATTSVVSDKMTIQQPGSCMEKKYWDKTYHKWVDSHGWAFFRAYCRLCGFYLTNLWTDAELVQYDSKQETPVSGLRFPARYSPIPETTSDKTTYTNATTWELTSGLGFGGGYSSQEGGMGSGSISFEGSLSYSYSTEREIADINIANHSTDSKASYQYVVNNLPHYQAASITISNPPLISVATGIFDTQWIWLVPDVPVRSAQGYYLKSTIDVTYGSCHFWTTGRDFCSTTDRRPSPIDQGPSVVYMAITPPNRIPTGVLVLEHSDDSNTTVTDVKFIPDGSDTPTYTSGDNQYKPGEQITALLPVGKYRIEFTKGTSDGTRKTYVSKNAVQINLAKQTQVYTDFNMKEK